MTFFKNRSLQSVSPPLTDDRPIVDRRSVESKPFAKSQRQLAGGKRKNWSVIIFLPPADPKKQLKLHTKSSDCRSTLGRFVSLSDSLQTADGINVTAV